MKPPRPRIIPCLLLDHGTLVKTVRFGAPAYVGDPRNAILIFNEKEVDELAFLDIRATAENREPDYALIERLASECFMPIAYGGGIRTLEQMRRIFRLGVEKVILNAAAQEVPGLLRTAAAEFGSQSLVASIDVRREASGEWSVYSRNGTQRQTMGPVALALQVQAEGAGEILLTSIDRDGTSQGYDLPIVQALTRAVSIPVIANGGAGRTEDFRSAVQEAGAAACAAGSLFVYFGQSRSVLINYPETRELDRLFGHGTASSPRKAAIASALHKPTVSKTPASARVCTRCLYGTHNVPRIDFNDEGLCNYCRTLDQLAAEYPRGAEGRRQLEAIAAKIREEGRKNRYDVVVGVSGGCDSSYMLILAKELGLRPLAVHFDNTWNSRIAVENIQCMLRALDVDLYTYVVNNEEYDDIYRSFLEAGTPDTECPTDIGLAVVLNRACEEHGIRYIFEGHSYRTEGICPLGWLYMDGRYIREVHRRFGRVPMKTYPNMPLTDFLRWTVINRLIKIRPLYYMDFQKEQTKALLAKDYGWQWYGGHHLENRFTAFFHTYFWPRRWGIDGRLLGHCALVWSGQMDRATALAEIEEPPIFDPNLVDYVRTRLGYSHADWERLMTLPRRTYRDYPNYKRTFERLRPLFWLLYKARRVPKSFVLKYCYPDKTKPFTGHTPVWGAPVPAAPNEII